MSKRILVDASYKEEVRLVVVENKKIQEYDYESESKPQLKGNIYLAKITRVEPSLQAAFIEYGNDKHGFLPFSEIHPSYFNVPVNDREDKKLEQNEDIISNLENLQAIAPPDLSDLHDEDEIIEEGSEKQSSDESVALANASESGEEMVVNELNFDDEEITEHEEKVRNAYHKYKIQEVIKKKQVILVQAIKEERGNKGASFTTFISLAGKYCVLMPNSNKNGGISRRIVELDKRRRLKKIIDSLGMPEGVGVIIRTAGEVKVKSEIKRDYDYLVRLWNSIREHTIAAKAPTFIHAESDVTKRTIRDLFDKDTSEVFVQGEEAFKAIKDFTKKLTPANVAKIKHYREKTPLFQKFNVEDQISALLNVNAPLDSGGYLVINATEALTAIDVNSGKSTSERNVEETAFKTNIEAAKEVARQIRLRDISGLIVIDFIDMSEYQNRRQVERTLRDSLKNDRAKIQVSNISPLGLVEMSRQRLKPSFLESKTVTCSHCSGKGKVRDQEINALTILRSIENEIFRGELESIILYAQVDVILYILNHKRDHIINIEKKYNVKIIMQKEHDLSPDSYGIERIKRTQNKDADLNNKPTVDEEEIQIDDVDSYLEEDEEIIIEDENSKDSNVLRPAFNNNPNRNEGNYPRRKNRDHFNRRGPYRGNNFKRKQFNPNNKIEEKQEDKKEKSWWNKIFS